MKEPMKVKGVVKITYHDTGETTVYENAFLNVGQNHFMEFLKGGFSIDGYKYLGIGTSDEPTDLEQETLGNEKFRKEISNIKVDGTKLILDTIVEGEEANLGEPWKELGLYMGGTAGLINSGLLYNRTRILENKDSRSAITISWEIEIITS